METHRIDILPIRNPALLRAEAVQGLFRRAFASSSLVPAWGPEVANDIVHAIAEDFMHVWVALADGLPSGLVVVVTPQGRLYPVPQVYIVYNEGPKAVVRALAQTGVDFLRQKGYNKYWGLNGLTDNDAVYARLFRHAGAGRRVGSVMEFTI